MSNELSDWPKKITVERKIVNLLSRSLYADFPRSIREAVSNSYDADATLVRINIDQQQNEITIEDNGNGMSAEQFDNYLQIAGTKSAMGFSEKYQRKRIGHFGVGFLASFPFCNNLELTSKREGLEVGFTANIPTKRFVEGMGLNEDISSIAIDGFNERMTGKSHEHYTRIHMIGLTELITEYFKPRVEKKRISIQSQPGMDRLKWELCETLPLDYDTTNSELTQVFGSQPVGMEVFLNKEKIYRNNPGGQVLASSGKTFIKLGNLEFKYVITTDWSIIHPVEARGLKIRVNGVGVGPRTYFDIEKEVRTFSRLNWLTGEVHVISGLDDSLALTRDSFIWSPEYEALKEFFHTVLLRVHSKVESVDEVEREVKAAVNRSGSFLSPSINDITEKAAKQLSNSGYQIIRKNKNEVGNPSLPIIIDKKRDVVTIIQDYPPAAESTNEPIVKDTQKIRYQQFSGHDKYEQPVRMTQDGIIEVNTSYPVFSGKTKGEILRRVQILLFIAKKECKTVEEMYEFMTKKIREEFR
jgi:hypothetical protein